LPARAPRHRARGGCALTCHPSSTAPDNRALYSLAADLSAAPSIGIPSTGCRRFHSAPRARSPTVCAHHVSLAASSAPRSPIPHRSDHWGNEGHCGPPQGGVRVSTSGAPQKRIKHRQGITSDSSDSRTSRIARHFLLEDLGAAGGHEGSGWLLLLEGELVAL